MGGKADNRVAEDIPIYIRGADRVDSGRYISLSYNPIRGKKLEQGRGGIVVSTERTDDDALSLTFHDEVRERYIEVVLDETVGESTVRSRKKGSDRWTTLGSPIRVNIGKAGDEKEELMNRTIREHGMKRTYESCLAVAGIRWNEQILDWMGLLEQKA